MFLNNFIMMIIIIQKILNQQILIDEIFKTSYEIDTISLQQCEKYNKENFHFQGKPIYIEDIVDEKDVKDSYDNNFIYISKEDKIKYIKLFPESSLFIISDSIQENLISKYKGYCFIRKNINYRNKLFFAIIGKNASNNYLYFVIKILWNLFMINLVLMTISFIKSCSLLDYHKKIYCYKFSKYMLIFSNFLPLTCLLIGQIFWIYIFYSITKAYLLSNLILFLMGYNILHLNKEKNVFFKISIIIFVYEIFLSFIFIYIVYFFPNLNNNYLFFGKTCLESLSLLVFTIYSFFETFVPFYLKFKLEEKLKSNIYLIYKPKIIFYGKILLYSFLYSIAFLVLYYIMIEFKVTYLAESFYYIYYFKIAMEMIFIIMLGILFFPFKVSFLFFITFDLDNLYGTYFYSKIETNNVNISLLTKKKLKKKHYPIVLIQPFTNDNKIMNKIHVGLINRK